MPQFILWMTLVFTVKSNEVKLTVTTVILEYESVVDVNTCTAVFRWEKWSNYDVLEFSFSCKVLLAQTSDFSFYRTHNKFYLHSFLTSMWCKVSNQLSTFNIVLTLNVLFLLVFLFESLTFFFSLPLHCQGFLHPTLEGCVHKAHISVIGWVFYP